MGLDLGGGLGTCPEAVAASLLPPLPVEGAAGRGGFDLVASGVASLTYMAFRLLDTVLLAEVPEVVEVVVLAEAVGGRLIVTLFALLLLLQPGDPVDDEQDEELLELEVV